MSEAIGGSFVATAISFRHATAPSVLMALIPSEKPPTSSPAHTRAANKMHAPVPAYSATAPPLSQSPAPQSTPPPPLTASAQHRGSGTSPKLPARQSPHTCPSANAESRLHLPSPPLAHANKLPTQRDPATWQTAAAAPPCTHALLDSQAHRSAPPLRPRPKWSFCEC